MLIETFMDKLNISVRNDTGTINLISGWILKKIKDKEKLDSAKSFAREIGVSNAMLSKYAKSIGYDNFSEVIFLIKNTIDGEGKEEEIISDSKIKKASKLILNSRKIFFVGVSSGYLSNLDFSHKLNRLDLWCVTSMNKYEQIGQSKLLTSDDLIIVNSVSLQHIWMKQIIDQTEAKVMVLTASDQKIKSDIIFHYNPKENASFNRNKTVKNRIIVLNIYDQIFNELIKDKRLSKLLRISSYSPKK